MAEATGDVRERDDEPRCEPHGNRLPCPMCLAERWPHLVIWNNF